MSAAPPPRADGVSRQRILVTVLFGMAANSFPITVLSASLPRIEADLNSNVGTTAWVLTAPVLAGAVFTPITGKLGDLFGHRRAYLAGFSASVVFLALTALSWNVGSLIGFRVAAAACGSITGPAAMALIISLFRGSERTTALGYWTATAALSPSLGVALGGPLIDAFGWQTLFIVQSIIALVAVILAYFTIPNLAGREEVKFDIPGAVTLGAMTFSLMFAINRARPWGIDHPAVIAGGIAAPVLAWLFWQIERRADAPLVPLSLLRNRHFLFPVAIAGIANGVYMGAFVITPLALDELFGYSTTAIAFVMLPRPISFGLAASASGHLEGRYRSGALIGGGVIGIGAGLAIIGLGAQGITIGVVVLGLLAMGIGQGISRPHLVNAVGANVPESDLGVGTGLMQMGTQIGTATGMTALVALLGTRTSAGAYNQVFMIGAAVAVIAGIAALRIRTTNPPDATAASVLVEPTPGLAAK